MNFIYFLLIGAVAGWLAGQIMKGRGLGLLGNVVVGVVGAFLGGWLLSKAGVTLTSGPVGSLITATLGAVVLLIIVGLIKKA